MSGYRHTAPSDYLFWGVHPSVEIASALDVQSQDNGKALREIVKECPVCLLDFKSDLTLQILGITRYDFDWDGLSRAKDRDLAGIFSFLSRKFVSREDAISAAPAPVAYSATFFGAFSVSAVLLLFNFLWVREEIAFVVASWMVVGLVAILPYIVLSPGGFFRYSAPSIFCFYVASFLGVVSLLGCRRSRAE